MACQNLSPVEYFEPTGYMLTFYRGQKVVPASLPRGRQVMTNRKFKEMEVNLMIIQTQISGKIARNLYHGGLEENLALIFFTRHFLLSLREKLVFVRLLITSRNI
jgi:hypothetical protein